MSHKEDLKETLVRIFKRETVPDRERYLELFDRVQYALVNEEETIRPRDEEGLPGGIVFLRQDVPTIVVPDLHARKDFFFSLMLWKPRNDVNVMQMLAQNRLQVVCVGDGFHAEGRAAERWQCAYREFSGRYRKHRCMDEEMAESLGVMEMVMEAKSVFGGLFHFLKGNHENISNEEGGGNHPFRKYAHEGAMVRDYVLKFYGGDFLDSFYHFEKELPLLAVGRKFLVSHAEPARFFSRSDIIGYRNRPEVVEGLTWTANDTAEGGSVQDMLAYFLRENTDGAYYFGGHRPVQGLYSLRAGGKYVQIHNPGNFTVALIDGDINILDINLERDVVTIPDLTGPDRMNPERMNPERMNPDRMDARTGGE